MTGTGHYQNLAPDPSWGLIRITAGMALGVGSELLCGLERCHQSFSFVTVPLETTAKCSVLLQLLLSSQLSSCMGISRSTSGPGLQGLGWQVVYWHLAEPKPLPTSILFPTRRCFEIRQVPFFPHVWAPCGWHPSCHPGDQAQPVWVHERQVLLDQPDLLLWLGDPPSGWGKGSGCYLPGL